MKNNHQIRLAVACLIALAVISAIFFLIPAPRPDVVVAAYCFGLFAPILVTGSLWQLAAGSQEDYITQAAYPYQVLAYAGLNLVMDAVAVILAVTGAYLIPLPWFCTIHIILLALYGWKVIAMSAAQDSIRQADRHVKAATCDWKLILATAEELLKEAPESLLKPVSDLRDAIRYADPVSIPELQPAQQEIAGKMESLRKAIRENTEEPARAAIDDLLLSIQNRNSKLKLLK